MARQSLRAVLVRPPVAVLHKFSKPVENLAIGYLAAALRRHGHEAVMLDGMLEDWSDEETVRRVVACTPDVIGFTTVLQRFPENLSHIVQHLRSGGFTGLIVVGGHAVSFFGAQILAAEPEIDAVVSGEGESSLVAILDAVAAGADWRQSPGVIARRDREIVSQPVRRIHDLDALGEPARDLTRRVIERDGLVCISTSRGCHARCSFCSVPRFYGLENGRKLTSGDWLARDPLACAAEVAHLHEHFGVREVLIVDDEFFGGAPLGMQRAETFADELAALNLPVGFAMSCRAENAQPAILERLQRGGLRHVFIGLEAGSHKDLKLYGKGHSVEQNQAAVAAVKALGLSFQPGFMLFNHRSTLDSIRSGLHFLEQIGELKPTTINSAVDPHFGVPLTVDMARSGVLTSDALAMTNGYVDQRVAALKAIAAVCAERFNPCMNFIATVQSAITYEWRRTVPGRTLQTQQILDAFEVNANREFSDVIWHALNELENTSTVNLAALLQAANRELDRAAQDLFINQGLVSAYVRQEEGNVRYVSQSELIANGQSCPCQ